MRAFEIFISFAILILFSLNDAKIKKYNIYTYFTYFVCLEYGKCPTSCICTFLNKIHVLSIIMFCNLLLR